MLPRIKEDHADYKIIEMDGLEVKIWRYQAVSTSWFIEIFAAGTQYGKVYTLLYPASGLWTTTVQYVSSTLTYVEHGSYIKVTHDSQFWAHDRSAILPNHTSATYVLYIHSDRIVFDVEIVNTNHILARSPFYRAQSIIGIWVNDTTEAGNYTLDHELYYGEDEVTSTDPPGFELNLPKYTNLSHTAIDMTLYPLHDETLSTNDSASTLSYVTNYDGAVLDGMSLGLFTGEYMPTGTNRYAAVLVLDSVTREGSAKLYDASDRLTMSKQFKQQSLLDLRKYIDVSSVALGGKNTIPSAWIMYLVQDSSEVVLKYRDCLNNQFVTGMEITLQLTYAFDGTSKVVAIMSDTHSENDNATRAAQINTVINDLDDDLSADNIDHAFVLGDVVYDSALHYNTGTYAWTVLKGNSDITNWYELAGNHDVLDVDAGGSGFETRLSTTLHKVVTIDNIDFIMISSDDLSPGYATSQTGMEALETALAVTTTQNRIIMTHHPRQFALRASYYYSANFNAYGINYPLIDSKPWNAWISAHAHGHADVDNPNAGNFTEISHPILYDDSLFLYYPFSAGASQIKEVVSQRQATVDSGASWDGGNQSINIDGTGNGIRTGLYALPWFDAFTIIVSIKPDSESTNVIISKYLGSGGSGTVGRELFLSVLSSDTLRFVTATEGSGEVAIDRTFAMNNSTWAEIAIQYDGANTRIFGRGGSGSAAFAQLGADSGSVTDYVVKSATELLIGSYYKAGIPVYDQIFDGSIAYVMGFAEALSEADIEAYMDDPTPNLINVPDGFNTTLTDPLSIRGQGYSTADMWVPKKEVANDGITLDIPGPMIRPSFALDWDLTYGDPSSPTTVTGETVVNYGSYAISNDGSSFGFAHSAVTFFWNGSDTTPIGGNVTSDGDYTQAGAGAYNAFRNDAASEYASFTTSGNISSAEGSMLFWFKSNAALAGDCTFFFGASDFKLEWVNAENDLKFTYGGDTVQTSVAITSEETTWYCIEIGWLASEEIYIKSQGVKDVNWTTIDSAPTLDVTAYITAEDDADTNRAAIKISDFAISSVMNIPNIPFIVGEGAINVPFGDEA